ncbi:hypothetical protein INT43_004219 [Umbelopsis isabellina]|uniref:Vacuolar protein sorting-associated protein 8 central domain-containing protein n=1 Tax=Mortierella isabellina TaxID=91625 RepID=A0A8H7PHR2_MORIS|nr:hypothetical protein INT43_004219 [Umbelopsis isabellina]
MEGSMQPSVQENASEQVLPELSSSTSKFRSNYDSLLREVLDESSEDEQEIQINSFDIDVNAATAELPVELRAALEDRALAEKYLANLRSFMSQHQRNRSIASVQSVKAENTGPAGPAWHTGQNGQIYAGLEDDIQGFPDTQNQREPERFRLLNSPMQEKRLVHGLQSVMLLEQKFNALRIPELDLPTMPETTIRAKLDELTKIRDDLRIHLQGGPLANYDRTNDMLAPAKQSKIQQLLEDVVKEIGFYEEFANKSKYLSLDNILNESDTSDDEFDTETLDTDSGIINFDASSDISKSSTPNGLTASASPGYFSSPALLSPSSITQAKLFSPASSPARRVPSDSLDIKPFSASLLRMRSSSPSLSSWNSSDAGVQQNHDTLNRSRSNNMDSSHELSITMADNDKENLEPWEAFKWTPLRKISDHLHSDAVRHSGGLATVMAVSGVIAIGTTRGLVLVYDYSQNLRCILQSDIQKKDLGPVTSIAISADHSGIACGFSRGTIVIWDIGYPTQPLRTIHPIPYNQVPGVVAGGAQPAPRKEGHIQDAVILHIGFVGLKKTEIVSGDDRGMAFYHSLYKVVMVNAIETTRILGRYQNLSLDKSQPNQRPAIPNANGAVSDGPVAKPKRPSTVFAMQPLPLGQAMHVAETFGLVALLTPYKMIIVGLKPSPQTQYKYVKPKTPSHFHYNTTHTPSETADTPNDSSLCGCLAWLPVVKLGGVGQTKNGKVDKKEDENKSDPALAFSWGQHLIIIQVAVEAHHSGKSKDPSRSGVVATSNRNKYGRLEFRKRGEWKCRDNVVALQWINRQILIILTANDNMVVFDPITMTETERVNIKSKKMVFHDNFTAALEDLSHESMTNDGKFVTAPGSNPVSTRVIEMAYYHSMKSYKGRLFLLGVDHVYIGTLLSWADRIIALVQSGDFLEGIALATSFYMGKSTQTVLGLPEDQQARHLIVGDKLLELLEASLNYTFSSKRTYEGMVDETSGGGTVLFHDLALGCTEACVRMNNINFLFDVAYERFADAGAQGVFLQVLEPYILENELYDIPPAVMKDLVAYFSQKRLFSRLEKIIWHVNPQCLDIDQVISTCQREGLYNAMIYVWNRSMNDYVSPVVELLKVIRFVIKAENPNASETAGAEYFLRLSTSSHQLPTAADVASATIKAESMRFGAEHIFDYLKSVLTGKLYPDNTPMSTNEANVARSAVYSFIFSGRCVVWPKLGGKLVLTAEGGDGTSEPTYPYLRLLLRFNALKFLDALETAFEDPWLNGSDDMLSSGFDDEMPGKVVSRQIIINTLLDVLGGVTLPVQKPTPISSTSESTVRSSGSELNGHPTRSKQDAQQHQNLIYLYIFISRNLHKYTTFILLPPTTLHRILRTLSEEHDPSTRDARQAAVQSLLIVYTPTESDQMILLYEEAGFYQVLEAIYRQDGKYRKLVEIYLKDTTKYPTLFDSVEELIDVKSKLAEKKKADIKQFLLVRISKLVEIDGQRTAELVQRHFGGDHEDIIKRLEDEEVDDDEFQTATDQRIFFYLRGLLEPVLPESDIPITDNTTKANIPPVLDQTWQKMVPDVDAKLHERYVDLMCRFDPSGVYNYLNTTLDVNYNLTAVLASCEKYGVLDAAVWIMEKSGDTKGALTKVLDIVREQIAILIKVVKEHQQQSIRASWTLNDENIINDSLVRIRGVLRVGTHLCENSSRKLALANSTDASSQENNQGFASLMMLTSPSTLTRQISLKNTNADSSAPFLSSRSTMHKSKAENESEGLWFRLLDTYVESSISVIGTVGSSPEKAAATSSDMPLFLHDLIISSFKSFVQSILTSLLLSTSSPHVSLPRLLLRLIQSQTNGETTFADFRDIFLGMLDTYKYEGQLLEMTNRLFEQDLFVGIRSVIQKKSRGWRPRRIICEICNTTLLDLSILQKPFGWDLDQTEMQPAAVDSSAAESSEHTASSGHAVSNDTNVSEPGDGVILFRCGHGYHRACLEMQSNSRAFAYWVCLLCDTVSAVAKGKQSC